MPTGLRLRRASRGERKAAPVVKGRSGCYRFFFRPSFRPLCFYLFMFIPSLVSGKCEFSDLDGAKQEGIPPFRFA